MHPSSSVVSTPTTYEVLKELSEIEAISPAWDALLERTPCNRAYSCSKWFLAACRVAPTLSPHVIVARRGEMLAGVFPLVVKRPEKEAAFPIVLSDYNDIIACADDDSTIAGLLDRAISGADGYERVMLRALRTDSNCRRAAQTLAPALGLGESLENKRVCPYIRLSSSYDEYLATRGRRFREGLRRAQSLARKNQIIVRELVPASFPTGKIADAFLRLHLSRFGDRSTLASPEVRPFLNAVIPDLVVEGSMRVFALFAGDDMLGINLCARGVNSLCNWNGGFLPEAALWSPGKLLIAAEIEQAYATGLEEYDFGRGAEDYKAQWATEARETGQLELACRLGPEH